MNINKWKKAVVHLECAIDSEHFYDRMKRMDELRKQLEEGAISQEEYTTQIAGKTRDVRFHGTAIFLKHNDKRYLLTARHVVWNEISAKREFEEDIQRYSQCKCHLKTSYFNQEKSVL